MIVGVVDGLSRVGGGQVLGVLLTINVVERTTVDGEMGRFMYKGSGPGVGTSVGDVPEGTAEVNLSKLLGN